MSKKQEISATLDEALRLAKTSKLPDAMTLLEKSLQEAQTQGNRAAILEFARLAGALSERMQKWENAEKFYRLALEENTEDPYAHFALGEILRRLGRESEARECYQACYAAAVSVGDNEVFDVLRRVGFLK